jgi:hypothetical protein
MIIPKPHKHSFEDLQAKLGCKWEAIAKARANTASKEALLTDLFTNSRLPLSSEMSVVVFGSIARRECTSGSDVDWTLLIDGQADPNHLGNSQEIERALESSGLAKPSPMGAFGKLVFSHSLIHNIGGSDDTNHNTTQRILMLLESVAFGNADAHRRVLRGIMRRYLEEDTSFSKDKKRWIPRFLLNDIVRYWRTVAVDYANKERARPGGAWALRNIKLRMSRKLMFVSGLIICFYSQFQNLSEARDLHSLMEELIHITQQTPIDIISSTFLGLNNSETGKAFFDAYDMFLSRIDDSSVRERLKDLSYEESESDPLFLELREMGHRFQKAISRLFFEDNQELKLLTQEYGVF